MYTSGCRIATYFNNFHCDLYFKEKQRIKNENMKNEKLYAPFESSDLFI